jgi:hypothetical protein
VPETVAKQDEAIKAIAETKEEWLDAQQEDEVESDPSDSSDDDYQPILRMPPRPHDIEANGSSSAPPQQPYTDLALLAILELMRQDQTRQA